MTVEADLYNVLKAICPRAFPDTAPVSTTRPYVTYQQIGGQAIVFTDDTIPSKENGEFQINVWADTRASANAIAKQIEAALITSISFQARPVAALAADHDPDMLLYGTRQDFTIWSNR